MPVEIRCRVTTDGLTPISAHDHDQLRLFAPGAEIKGTFVKRKSRAMLRLYWATVEEVADGLGETKELLSHRLLHACGQYDGFHAKDGALLVVPKSIARMQAGEFKSYVSAALVELFAGHYGAHEAKADVIRIAERKARTTYRDAMAELDAEIARHNKEWEQAT